MTCRRHTLLKELLALAIEEGEKRKRNKRDAFFVQKVFSEEKKERV